MIATTQRIVSLVPSLTELLFDLGLDKEIVGITKFCIHPASKVKDRLMVGGTKNVHLERVAALKPTLILANKEENTREDVEALQTQFPLLLTDVTTFSDALLMIQTVGDQVQCSQQANQLIAAIETEFKTLEVPKGKLISVAYLIWRKPWMVAGSQTFIDTMLTKAGFLNAFKGQVRYPAITTKELLAANPDVIMLSSEPYPFTQNHADELAQFCPQAKIMLVDGELFSWYGSRMIHSADYFRTLRQCLA